MPHDNRALAGLIEKNHAAILSGWLAALKRSGKTHDSRAEATIAEQARQFLDQLRKVTAAGQLDDITTPEWAPVRDMLEDLSRARAADGFSPSETAAFVFSIKEPL